MHKTLTILSIFFLTITISSCTRLKESSVEYYEEYFDTYITLRVWDNKIYDNNDKLWKGAENIMQNIQNTFKRTAPDNNEDPSELYLLNQSAGSTNPVQVSDELFDLIKTGINFAKDTEGRFDPTVGALVDLWGITGEVVEKERPENSKITEMLALVDYNLIKLNEENKSVMLPKKGMVIDLGAIAKGYAADKLAEYFYDKGIEHALLNLGGNIYAIGERYEKGADGTTNWIIGIRTPLVGSLDQIGQVSVRNKTVVTSGTYERYIYDPVEEKRYHHILDTTTGFPVDNNLLSVTIISESSTTADALSTAVFSMGLDKGLDFVEYYDDVEAIFVYWDNNGDMKIKKSSGADYLYHFKEKK